MDKKTIRSVGFAILISLAGVAVIIVATGGKAESLGWYLRLIYLKANTNIIIENLVVYRNAFVMFFEQEVLRYINTVSLLLIIPAMVLGFFSRIFRKIGIIELFIVFYCGLLLIYPFHHEPIRFLVPVLGMGIIYMTEFYMALFTKLKQECSKIAMVVLSIMFLVTNFKNTVHAFTHPPSYSTENGATKELFNFIKTSVPINQIISFYKPWAISYFTGHPSVPSTSSDEASIVILSKSEHMYHFGLPSDRYTKIFENEEYILYEKREIY